MCVQGIMIILPTEVVNRSITGCECRRYFRQRLHGLGFIRNRIVFDAVTPSVYTTPIKTIGETGRLRATPSVYTTPIETIGETGST